MALQRSDRLKVVLQMEDRREEKAQQGVQLAARKAEEERGRLQELLRYQEEYQLQIRQQQKMPQSSRQLIGWQQFLSQLDGAIAQQQAQVQRVQSRLEEVRKVWREIWEKRAAMARHIDDCRRQEQQDADRREQKGVDETANLRYGRPDRRR